MKIRSLTAAVAAAACAATLATGPAQAEDTIATFAVTSSGTLGISVPASTVDLGSVSSGTTSFTPSLGTVTVTDTRAAVSAAWTATATGTHFDLQGAGADPVNVANHRVANTAITYTAVPSVDVGTGTATPTAGTLAAGSTVVFAGTGSNTVSWNPALGFTLLATQSAGTYQGTVTHSVS